MLTPCRRGGVWVLVKSADDSPGMPDEIVARFPGPFGQLRAFGSYWARVLLSVARRWLRR